MGRAVKRLIDSNENNNNPFLPPHLALQQHDGALRPHQQVQDERGHGEDGWAVQRARQRLRKLRVGAHFRRDLRERGEGSWWAGERG